MQEPLGKVINQETWSVINDRFQHLSTSGTHELVQQGHQQSSVVVEKYLNLRYEGTDCALMCSAQDNTAESFTDVFLKK